MCKIEIYCPKCQSLNLVKNGKTANKKQKYLCRNCRKQFITDYTYQGCRPFIRSLILRMTLNSSGIRDISRVLRISTNTVQKLLLKHARKIPEERVPTRAKTVELDEFWSFVRSKSNQRWTWLAITSSTRRIGAFVNGRRTDKNCRQLLSKYQNSQIQEFASDDWQSYQKYLPSAIHYIGKDKTQRIERVNLNASSSSETIESKNDCFFKDR